jgi:hypothetical protein
MISNLLRGLAMAAPLLLPFSLCPSDALAQTSPPGVDRLPQSSPPMPVLRRGADGKIEVLKPERSGAGEGCAQTALCVGATGGYRTIADALKFAPDGSVVEIMPGTYNESVAIVKSRITMRGVGGRPHVDCAGLKLAQDKACLLLAGDNITIENLEVSGAAISRELGENAACVRNEPGRSFTLKAVICHGSQNGLLTDGGDIVIENSEFFDNGWNGLTHNAYLSGNCTATVRGSIFRDAREGHEFKSRCRRLAVENSTFRAMRGSRAIDIPDGSEAIISGGIIWQSRGVQNPDLVGYAAESCKTPAPLQLIRVRIMSSHLTPRITNYGKCQGQPIVMRDVIVEGTEPKLYGYILVNGVERPNAVEDAPAIKPAR